LNLNVRQVKEILLAVLTVAPAAKVVTLPWWTATKNLTMCISRPAQGVGVGEVVMPAGAGKEEMEERAATPGLS
jgi:hypothetical protein